MKNRLFIGLFLTIVICITSYGQNTKYAFVEVGGASIIASANFDMRFAPGKQNGLGFRAGVGNTLGLFGSDDVKDVFIFPIGLNYVYGKDKNALVLGINSSISVMSKDQRQRHDSKTFIFSPEIGYRYRPNNNGLGFHASYTPLFGTVEGTMPVWVGIGLGYYWR